MKRLGILCFLLLGYCLPELLSAERIKIVTTYMPAYWWALNVAGGMAEVQNLLPPGVSPHDYQLSPGDLKNISSASVILVNGLGLERFLERALQNSGPKAREKVFTLSDGLKEQLLPLQTKSSSSKGAVPMDPHIWLDPVLAQHCVTNILAALVKADPHHASNYRTNAETYIGRLKKLDAEIIETLQPVQKTLFVTYHNAFQYFVRRYDLELAAVVEETPEVAPAPGDVARLIGTIRAKRVRAIFTEPASNPRLATQIARDTGIRVGELDPLETGSRSPDGYETGLRRNAAALVKALQ